MRVKLGTFGTLTDEKPHVKDGTLRLLIGTRTYGPDDVIHDRGMRVRASTLIRAYESQSISKEAKAVVSAFLKGAGEK